MLLPLHNHGSRQWRCEAETAGRILRSQAERKRVFNSIKPILADGLINHGKKRKNRKALFEAIENLRTTLGGDADSVAFMLNLTEQACNFYLKNGKFPETYEEMQVIPTLKLGMLTYAADDGGKNGQTYGYEIREGQLYLRLRTPDENGKWRWLEPVTIPLPEETAEFVQNAERLCAPTLRAVEQPDGSVIAHLDIIIEREVRDEPVWQNAGNILAFDWGVRKLLTVVVLSSEGEQISRPFFLNTGGFDGKQARLRRQIDCLKSKRDKLDKTSEKYQKLDHQITVCWRAYKNRNRAMAHLAANFLLMLAELYNCHVIAGEWLATLKAVGRGKHTRSRWRNWRINTTIRSEITDILKYKCKLAGVLFRKENPRNTSHTCPRCGCHAETFESPEENSPADWGAWLKCANCAWNGSRDYAAAINIGRLAVPFYKKWRADKTAKKRPSFKGFRIDDLKNIKPASYIGAGAVTPFLPHSKFVNATETFIGKKIGKLGCKMAYFTGWIFSATVSPLLLNQPACL